MEKNIAVIWGDCSSPEIVKQTLRVLDKVAEKYGHTFHYTAAAMGGEAIDKYGDPLPQHELDKCLAADSVLLGAVGGPKWEGLPGEQRPEKGLLAGLWQPVLWEGEHLLQAEVLARLAALGLDTGTAAPAALPAAKHIFTHIEWLMSGVQLRVAAQSAPAGYVWASREQLRTTYTLPGAFRAYKPLLL